VNTSVSTACADVTRRAAVVFGDMSPNPMVVCVIMEKYTGSKFDPKCFPGSFESISQYNVVNTTKMIALDMNNMGLSMPLDFLGNMVYTMIHSEKKI